MDIAFNPATRWNELMAWFVGHPTAPSSPKSKAAARSDTRPSLASPERQLAAGDTLRAAQPEGMTVVCLTGTLWITHDGDEADHIVVAGNPYVARHDGLMLVHAMSEARCLLIAPRG